MGATAVQYSFSGHETFPFRYPWLKKGFDAVCEDPGVFLRDDAIDGYILTPTGRDLLRHRADALRGDSSTRAWSLTGPYGSGKSAFDLFAAQLLTGEEPIRHRICAVPCVL